MQQVGLAVAKFFDAANEDFYAHAEGGFIKVEAGVMVGIGESFGGVSGTEEKVAAGNGL